VPLLSSRPITAFASRFFDHCIPIFMVHRMRYEGQPITGTTPDHLRDCLHFLNKTGCNPVSLEDLILAIKHKTQLPDKAVVFTMDDGYIDQALLAAPIFIEFNCPLTFFVITGMPDHALWPWDAQVSWIINQSKKTLLQINLEGEIIRVELGSHSKRSLAREKVRDIIKELDNELIPDILIRLAEAAEVSIPDVAPPDYQPLDWEMARELEAKGIRFAPHSRTHRILSKLHKTSMENEIMGSWETLGQELANPLKVFCYPTGRTLDFGPREIGVLKKQGFLGAVSTIPGYVEIQKDPLEQIFHLPRFDLPGNMTDLIQYSSWIEHAKGVIRS
jgi:peptidoglycan/xylan/chitin deacetylase (PgdA/CDA1 family)